MRIRRQYVFILVFALLTALEGRDYISHMTAQRMETIKIQRIPEQELTRQTNDTPIDNKQGIKEWIRLLSQFVTVGGDFA